MIKHEYYLEDEKLNQLISFADRIEVPISAVVRTAVHEFLNTYDSSTASEDMQEKYSLVIKHIRELVKTGEFQQMVERGDFAENR